MQLLELFDNYGYQRTQETEFSRVFSREYKPNLIPSDFCMQQR